MPNNIISNMIPAVIPVSGIIGIADLPNIWNHSIEDYGNTSATIPLSVGIPTKIINNGLGTTTNISLLRPGMIPMWNVVTSQLDLSGTSIGDTVTIRMDFEVTIAGGGNAILDVELDMGIGATVPGNPLYTLTVADQYYKNANVYQLIILAEIYIGDSFTKDYPAEILVTSDSAGEVVKYNGHYLKAAYQHPIYIAP